MNRNLAHQQTPRKAEPRPQKDSLLRRQSNIWPGETPLQKRDDEGLDGHENPSTISRAKPMEEEAEAKLKDAIDGGDLLHGPASGRPGLPPEGEGRTDTLEVYGSQSAAQKIQKGVKTRQAQPTAPPFPRRAEVRIQPGSSKQRKLPADQDAPVKANARRLSSTRHSKSPPTVVTADSLERSPWTGQRPEDRLTDLVIKSGYCDKAQVHNEANTAKPSLWPHLKNGSGIHNLSQIFAAVLKRKEENGRVTASSTFKPPPRVTLTDTKREAWIRDLADPDVPLRRLSRTIPHGIRGKPLLDQCLAKQIPMTRAVWLARCVGANELRAFRRKGISGSVMIDNEIRWTKEWTTIVETFNQECVEARSNRDWKTRVTYAIQLTARFFFSGLLDRDHFFDWLLTNIERYTWEIFPVSLFSARNYWRELASSLRYGRRLAVACCTRLSDLIRTPHRHLLEPIMSRLEQFVREIIVSNPSCMVAPAIWSQIRHIFESQQRKTDEGIGPAVRKIIERNVRFRQARNQSSTSEPRGAMALIAVLDSATAPISYDALASMCLSCCSDIQKLITTTVQWAASPYRSEYHHVYLAAGLLRTWMHQGFQVEDHLLHALSDARSSDSLSFKSLGRLLAELMRSRHLDSGRYLRWLIASGVLNGCSVYDKRLSCDVEILLAMPQYNLPPNLVNLRRMLLRSVGHRIDNTEKALASVKYRIEHLVSNCYIHPQFHDSAWSSELYTSISALTMAEKYALGETIRLRIASLLGTLDLTVVSAPGNSTFSASSDVSQIILYQSILETLRDFSALDDAFQRIVTIADTTLLTSMANSVARCTEAFDAAAPGQTLWIGLQQRYRVMRLTSPPLKSIALPLLQIATRMKADKGFLHHLEAEISMSDASLTVAAYTPVSDMQLDASQPSHGDFEESIEQLVANSTTIDARVIARIFEAIVNRVRQNAKIAKPDFFVVKPFVARLRSYDDKLFDNLATEWVIDRLGDTHPSILADMVCILSDAGCVTLSSVVHQVDEYCDRAGNAKESKAHMLAVCFLAMLLPQPRVVGWVEIDWAQIWQDQPRMMLRCLRRAICLSPALETEGFTSLLHDILSSQVLLTAMNRILLVEPAMVYQELDLPALVFNTPTLPNLIALVSHVIDPFDHLGMSVIPTNTVIHKLFETVDGFSLPIYQFGLRVFSLAFGTDQAHITSVILDAAKITMSRDCVLCAKLISVLDKSLTKEIRVFAEQAILEECSQVGIKSGEQLGVDISERESLEKYLDVIEATLASIPENGEPGINQTIIKALGSAFQHIRNGQIAGAFAKPSELLQLRIQTILRLSLIHTRSFSLGDSKIALLCVLCNFLVMRTPSLTTESREFIFDVAGYFSADLTPRDLNALHDALGTLAQYPLMRFLFGFRPPTNAWLHLDSSTPSTTTTIPEPQQPQTPSGFRVPTQQQQQQSNVFPLRQWELLPDSTPNIGVNDTALSLRLFDARKM